MFTRVDLNPQISKICASWMSVWNISANYVLVPLKFNLKCNIWKPFLKSSPLDFSGQRLWNTSLVVFLWLHSFSLVVKWPEYARVYRTNFLSGYYVKSAQWSEGPVLLQEVLGSGLTYYGILCTHATHLYAFYQANSIILEKTVIQKYIYILCWVGSSLFPLPLPLPCTGRKSNMAPSDWQSTVETTMIWGTRQLLETLKQEILCMQFELST